MNNCIFQAEIELNEGIAVVQGSNRLPLDQLVRVYHLNCCQNILMRPKQEPRCPTLNWRSLTNYLDFIAVLESQANMKFPHNEVSCGLRVRCPGPNQSSIYFFSTHTVFTNHKILNFHAKKGRNWAYKSKTYFWRENSNRSKLG